MSRLKMAWLVLIALIAGLLVAAVLAPPPQGADTGVEIALPDAPDGFAAAPTAEARLQEPRTREEADAPALPRVVLGSPGPQTGAAPQPGGEVVITMTTAQAAPDTPASAAPSVPPGAPDPVLTAPTDSGRRPAIGPDGRTPFAAYRRLAAVGDREGVAVIVSGLGLDAALTDAAIALPPAVSLGFAPYAKDLPAQIERARAAGHEVLIELPMGTPGVAPAALGPAGLLTERSPAANAKRLEWLLTRADAYPMVTNYLGAGFASDEAAMARVMRDVSRLGVAYVDDTGAARPAARFAGVPYAGVVMLIKPDTDDVPARLRALSDRAAPGDVALAKVYAARSSIDAVRAWADDLPTKAILVPASTAVSDA